MRTDDEEEALTAHEELKRDGFAFCLGLRPGMPWEEYVALLDAYRRGERLPEDYVPETFLLAFSGATLVGRTSIRHGLNAFLEREGGHIGFGVRPAFRRRGYATEILSQSLVLARSVGIDRVLLTCSDGNEGSAAVIARCGGVLDSVVASQVDGTAVRRYWIE